MSPFISSFFLHDECRASRCAVGPRIVAALATAAMVLTLSTGTVAAQSGTAPAGTFSIRPVPDQDLANPANPARSHAQTSLSWFTFNAAPGETVADALRVANTGAISVDLAIYPVDAGTGVTSGLVMQNRTAPRSGVGAWTSVSTDSVHLQPGESRDVGFSLVVPADAGAGEHWGGLMAEDANVRKGSGQFAVNQVMRSGIALGVLLPGPRVESLAIKRVSERVVNSLNEVFVVEIANEGNVMVKPQGRFELRDQSGTVVAEQPLTLDNVLAGTTIPYEFFWSKTPVPSGRYTASVSLSASPGAEPVVLSNQPIDIQAPGARIAPAPAAASGAPAQVEIVPAAAPATAAAPAPAAVGSNPLQMVIPAAAGAALVLVGLGAYQLARRRGMR